MEFLKRPALVDCCIRLHNYCFDLRIEIEQDLVKPEGLMKIMPEQEFVAPYINDKDVPVNNTMSFFYLSE